MAGGTMQNGARAKISSRPPVEGSDSIHRFLDQELFTTMLRLERKRTERSHRRFVLMLLEARSLLRVGEEQGAFDKVVAALSHNTRETDIKGWYKDDSVIGVIFTEVGAADGKSV